MGQNGGNFTRVTKEVLNKWRSHSMFLVWKAKYIIKMPILSILSYVFESNQIKWEFLKELKWLGIWKTNQTRIARIFFKITNDRGAWMAQSVRHPTLDFQLRSWSHGSWVWAPHWLRTDSEEPAWYSLSFSSLSDSPCSCSPSQK